MFWTITLGVLAEIVVAVGDERTAAAIYPRLLPFADRNVAATVDISLGSASRLLGGLATVLGNFDDAERHFDEALRHHAAWGAEAWTAHTLYAKARMLAARGAADLPAARDLLAAADSIAQRLGMATLTGKLAAERPRAVEPA